MTAVALEADPQAALDSYRDIQLLQELMVKKWSRRTTLNNRTGKVEYIDWLNSERVGSYDVPALKSDKARATMALLLENQSRFQQSKSATVKANGQVLMQDTADSDLALPTKYALPIIRRMYAKIMDMDFLVTQALPGPTGYVFWLDFIREQDTTDLLSVEYNSFITAEAAAPQKGKTKLTSQTIQAIKQLMGTTYTAEAMEDARAQLGLDIDSELTNEFAAEFMRNLFGRQLLAIYGAASGSGTNVGASLVLPWLGPNTLTTMPNKGSLTDTDYKASIYASVIDADVLFQRANRQPSNAIMAGYGLAGFLQKLNTATGATSPADDNSNSLGISDYGTYAARWKIWGTDFLPNDKGFLYVRNPSQLQAGHVYAPYIPISITPPVYGGYSATTGNYTNTDEYTRNIRERSAYITTKPYAFMPISGPTSGLAQF